MLILLLFSLSVFAPAKTITPLTLNQKFKEKFKKIKKKHLITSCVVLSTFVIGGSIYVWKKNQLTLEQKARERLSLKHLPEYEAKIRDTMEFSENEAREKLRLKHLLIVEQYNQENLLLEEEASQRLIQEQKHMTSFDFLIKQAEQQRVLILEEEKIVASAFINFEKHISPTHKEIFICKQKEEEARNQLMFEQEQINLLLLEQEQMEKFIIKRNFFFMEERRAYFQLEEDEWNAMNEILGKIRKERFNSFPCLSDLEGFLKDKLSNFEKFEIEFMELQELQTTIRELRELDENEKRRKIILKKSKIGSK